MVAETDFLMGQVLDAAKASGVYDDTIVIFLSDHGEMNMEHRQVWKNAQSLRGVRARAAQCAALLDTARKSLTLDPWRGKARHKPSALLLLLDRRSALQYAAICCNMWPCCPAVISGGARAGANLPRGLTVSNLTSLLDMYPTLLSIARLPQPKAGMLAGSSLAPFLNLDGARCVNA